MSTEKSPSHAQEVAGAPATATRPPGAASPDLGWKGTNGPPPRRTALYVAIAVVASVVAIALAVVLFLGGRDDPGGAGGATGTEQEGGGEGATGGGETEGEATGGGTEGEATGGGTEGEGPGGGTEEPETVTKPPLNANSLRELVQDRVGRYALKDATENAVALQAGATEAYDLTYVSGGGLELYHNVSAYESAAEVQARREALVENLQGRGWALGFQVDISAEGGGLVGRVAYLEKEGTGVLAWSNGNLYAVAIGDRDSVFRFFRLLPY